jgi:hypothetical protein
VRVLSETVNNVVVHTEGRRYPGLVVQGDRLHEWMLLAERSDPNSLELLAESLREAVAEYERVSVAAGLGVPWS